ncbi:MAG: M23 family metallopeptidase [Candidatus Obscuribacterales bacterium]|nr:M23 family metallopeptidase [Candidatus Obscuribacterales bacterium]
MVSLADTIRIVRSVTLLESLKGLRFKAALLVALASSWQVASALPSEAEAIKLGTSSQFIAQSEGVSQESEISSNTKATFRLSSSKVKQGEVVEAIYQGPALTLPVVEFNSQKYPLFVDNDTVSEPRSYRSLISVPVVLKTGPRQVKLLGTEFSAPVTVVDAKYPVQRMTLPPSKNNFNTAPGEEEAVDKAKKTASERRYWSSNFTAPSSARVSAGFGLRRIVNGKLLDDYFHSGLDYAGWLGSPVKACAPGKIVLAVSKGFKLHGNTVAIDHGQGVVSFYIHLSKVLVKEGQLVKAGEQIGAIGQTGRANGPHLHFSIYVNGNASSPWQWFNRAF